MSAEKEHAFVPPTYRKFRTRRTVRAELGEIPADIIKDLLDNRGDLVRGLCLNRAGVKLGIGGGESMTVEATVTYRAHQLQVGGGTHRVHVLEAGAEVRVAKGSGTFSVPDSFPVTCAFWVRGDNHHQEGGEEKLILPGENKLAEFNLRKDGQDSDFYKSLLEKGKLAAGLDLTFWPWAEEEREALAKIMQQFLPASGSTAHKADTSK